MVGASDRRSAMALHIKNPRVETLARELSARTGESLTMVIRRALEERLERLLGRTSEPDVFETLLAISRRCSALPDLDSRQANEILGYDEAGAFGLTTSAATGDKRSRGRRPTARKD